MSQASSGTGERCGSCRFFLPNKDSNPKDPVGLCRRFPPQVIGAGDEFASPVVSDLDWCGEYQAPRR